jgi:glycosyltransferase involved in cell wall biosynthesis
MKIAYATTFDAHDVHNWSGTPFYMSEAFAREGNELDYIGNLKRQLPAGFKIKQTLKKWLSGQRESPRFNLTAAKHYSEQAAQILGKLKADVVLAPQMNPVAFLECKQPIVLWTDAVYSSLVGFYPAFNNHSRQTIAQGNLITEACLARSQLAIFSSEWAARAAVELYGADRNKVKVVPFGANMHCTHTLKEVQTWVKNRSRKTIKLLFLGKRWEQKGGPLVLKVAQALHAAGEPVELTIVGCLPPHHEKLPSYIHCPGFISKRTPEGLAKITRLLQEAHFLFVPSQGEAYGIVFCEANAYGLPCLTSYVGGISTIVKDDLNGKTFALQAKPEDYCAYVVKLMRDLPRYEELALASFNEYETRLNWRTAVNTTAGLIKEIL